MLNNLYSEFLSLPWAGFIVVSLVMATAAYFRNRTGSGHGLLARLYAIILGGNKFHDLDLERFWQARQDVDRFNALFNIGAKNLSEVKKFYRWINLYSLDVNIVSNIAGYIDFDSMKIVKIKKRKFSLFFFLMIACLALAFVSLRAGFSSYAIVKMKDGDQWFGLNSKAAISKSFSPLSFGETEWIITPDLCKTENIMNTKSVLASGIDEDGVSFICSSFNSEEVIRDLNKIKEEQKLLLLPSLFFFFFAYTSLLNFIRYCNIEEARRYIDKNCHD